MQIGSDLYLLFDPHSRHELAALAARVVTTTTLTGTFVSDSPGSTDFNDGTPLEGTFTFSAGAPPERAHIVNGCYRPPDMGWFLRPFPWWTQFAIVPTFSVLSSLANLQPLRSPELVVMVAISCVSYAANKIANHFIFNRSDVVSAIGAFTVGLLGNVYSRKMGGTAFTSMVTGVLFLVPVSPPPASRVVCSADCAAPVGSVASRRHHRSRERHRHRRRDDSSHNWYHRRPVHEPGPRVHVRVSQERSYLLLLNSEHL